MAATEKQIAELEEFFAKTKLPATVQLDGGTTITDPKKFADSHLTVLRSHGDKPMYEVFYLRLLKLKEIVAG